MDSVSAAAAYSTAQSTEQVKAEAGIQVLKKAQEQNTLVLELLDKTFQAAATGLGRNLDVEA